MRPPGSLKRQHAAAEILSFLRCRNQRAHPAAHWLGAQAAGKEPALSGAPAHGVHRDLHDTLLAPNPERFYKDVGIVAQTMLLGAVDMGLGGIMIGNFAPEKVRQALGLRETLVPC